MGRLTVKGVEALKAPGRYSDGDGLHLVIDRAGRRYWVLRYQLEGRRRDMSLGPAGLVSLAEARALAAEARNLAKVKRVDPVEARLAEAAARRETERAARASREILSFRDAALAVQAEHAAGWKGGAEGKLAKLWLRTMETYAFPAIGRLPVSEIEPHHIRDMLAPIWVQKPETARRVFQRTCTVLDWGHAKGWRPAEVPTRTILKGLPEQGAQVKHHAAMPFDDVPAFLAVLREDESVSRLALEALVLTAARSGEIRGATWDEIDLERALWTMPAKRMKEGRPHVVPLSPAALSVFNRALAWRRAIDPGQPDFVFPGEVDGRPLSDMTLTRLLRRMGQEMTAHGFRSSLRDWVAEKTNFPREVAEMALAHEITSKVERAYRRGNLLEKRRELMNAWGRFCTAERGKVVRLGVA